MIDTTQVSINTFTASVRALHVADKQMTLAVFRQIPISWPEPDGLLWGWVNYEIRKDCNEWLVFSKNGILYKAPLETLPDLEIRRAFGMKSPQFQEEMERAKYCRELRDSLSQLFIAL